MLDHFFPHTAWYVEIPQPGIEPMPLLPSHAVAVWSLNHWTTREVLDHFLKSKFVNTCEADKEQYCIGVWNVRSINQG